MSEIITDQNKELGNYTQLSNLIDELELSPLAIAIYFHYKRWANAERKNKSGVKDLMKKYKVGSAAIASAKRELIAHKLVKIDESGRKKGLPDNIQILDIVKRNFDYFEAKKEASDPLLDSNSTPHQLITRPVTIQELDPLLDSNAYKKEKSLKEKEGKGEQAREEKQTPTPEPDLSLPQPQTPRSEPDKPRIQQTPTKQPGVFGADAGMSPAEAVYREFFGGIFLSGEQTKLLGKVSNLQIWREVCRIWRNNAWRASNLGNMLNRYETDLKKTIQAETPKPSPCMTPDAFRKMQAEYLNV